MSCEAYREALAADTLGTIEPGEARELRAHLAECEGCRAEAATVQRLADGLTRELRDADEAMRASAGRPALAPQSPQPKHRRIIAAAAGLLFLITLSAIFFLHRSGPDGEPPAPAKEAPSPPDASAPPDVAERPPGPIRVLYVEGPPRYEYRFLKNALLRDSTILAHCWLSSGDKDFPQEHTKSDDSLFRNPLEGFPADLQSLLAYDVIIYGDVDPARLRRRAAEHVLAFVRDHGRGLILIYGSAHNPRTLAKGPLKNLLPVIPSPGSGWKFGTGRLRILGYRLTEAGRLSPLTSFAGHPGVALKLDLWEDWDREWNGLTPIQGVEPLGRIHPDATALVTVAAGPEEPDHAPLFVTRTVGRGRVFWSGTDETWLWRHRKGDEPYFYPFWRRVIDWAAGRQLERVPAESGRSGK